MSAASTKRDHSTHGSTRKNDWNHWTKDTKTKTAKCRLCGKKICASSWQCNRCGERICSNCCEDDPTGVDDERQSSKDMLLNGCWCRYSSGMNPIFGHLMNKPPPKQEAQMAKVRSPSPITRFE